MTDTPRTIVVPAAAVQRSRAVERIVTGQPTQDGAGVKLVRVLTQDLQRRLDPFLMLDSFRSDDADDYIAGFPDHPHRGFETVTYMLAGRMRHRDSRGNEGLITAGGVQWMTAARGLVHSEMPEQQAGLMEGFQLWLNLPGRRKLSEPGYQDLPGEAIPQALWRSASGDVAPVGLIRLIAGQAFGVDGAIRREDTEPVFVDLHWDRAGTLELPLPAGHNAFVYVYRGALQVGAPARPVAERQMAILQTAADADGVVLAGAGESGGRPATRAIVVAGRPLNEPIAQYGPFVMNTREELMQAVHDFQSGAFG